MITLPLYLRKDEALCAIMQVIVKRSMGHMAKIDGRSRSSEGTGTFTPREGPC
jgi:hypothetical protein